MQRLSPKSNSLFLHFLHSGRSRLTRTTGGRQRLGRRASVDIVVDTNDGLSGGILHHQ